MDLQARTGGGSGLRAIFENKTLFQLANTRVREVWQDACANSSLHASTHPDCVPIKGNH